MIMSCPGCGGNVPYELRPIYKGRIGRCERCDGLIGEGLSEAAAFKVVQDKFHSNSQVVRVRYYDLTYYRKDTGVLDRRHGWYDPDTGLMLQGE